ELSGSPSSEVEWLLDNNVNIINNSWGDSSPNGEYASTSAYFDYIVYTSRVTVVVAAGNDGNVSGYVGNPGLGYNVITVGNSYDTGAIYVSSSYDEAFSISKPTLTAPGYSISVPNFPNTEYIDGVWYLLTCGTSFSAPIVTGSIALLMQRYPILKMYPEKIISTITAASSPVSGFNDFDTSGLEEKVGSGMFNYNDCSTVYLNGRSFSFSESHESEYVSEKRVYLSAGTDIRISLAWLINSENNTQTDKVTDLDLHFAYDNGTIITTSSSGGNNIEFIDYTITSSGYYRIKVYQFGPINCEGVIYGSYTYNT
ncbi:MAG: S8 family peptidase, partial [Candidatus Cloacimonetes bacterium]|nr:S8 family peptidase [Candidatus Cloacimonadota bacterium]